MRAVTVTSLLFLNRERATTITESNQFSDLNLDSEQYLHKPVTCATNDSKAQSELAPHWPAADVIFRPTLPHLVLHGSVFTLFIFQILNTQTQLTLKIGFVGMN